MTHPLTIPTLAQDMAIAVLAAPLAARLRLQTEGPVDRLAYHQVWTRLLGLPSEEALAVLAQAGVTDAQVEDERQRRAWAAQPRPPLPSPATEGQISDWHLPAKPSDLDQTQVVPHGRLQGQRSAVRPELADLARELHALAAREGDTPSFVVTSAAGYRYRGDRLPPEQGDGWWLRQMAQQPPSLAAMGG